MTCLSLFLALTQCRRPIYQRRLTHTQEPVKHERELLSSPVDYGCALIHFHVHTPARDGAFRDGAMYQDKRCKGLIID